MRNFLIIWRREFASCFLSPIAYVTMVVFLVTSGFTFLVGVDRNVGGSEPLGYVLFSAIILWATILIAVISMRLFAEEKRSGTIETLMTAPITETQIVMGKYAGALAFLVIVMAPAFSYIFILEKLSPGITMTDVDVGGILGGALIMFLVSGFFLSMGLLVSLLTRNQIVSGICCISAIWLALLFGWLLGSLPIVSPLLAEYFSATTHIEDFSRGAIDTRTIVLYVTGIFFMLFVSVRVLESRRWR